MEKGPKGWMDGGLQEEAIMPETWEGLESEGGGGRSAAEDGGRGLRAKAERAAAVNWGWFVAEEEFAIHEKLWQRNSKKWCRQDWHSCTIMVTEITFQWKYFFIYHRKC